ncbi:hypothetical protein niasHS_012354 [Heterodera schachtii]|uniref:Uncharacterized protein n=1 Tax=Heterodera schachtii TaxID=97005 RepID=A0ABD2IUG7_HETSC
MSVSACWNFGCAGLGGGAITADIRSVSTESTSSNSANSSKVPISWCRPLCGYSRRLPFSNGKMRRNGGKAINAAANGGQRPPVNRIQLLTATNGQKQRHGKRGQQTMKSYGDGRRRAGKADPN